MMDFRLDDEQQAIQDLVRKFARNELAAHEEEWEAQVHFPREIVRPLAGLGLMGILIPEELGGTQLSRVTGAMIYEELASADMATATWLSVHNMVAGLIYRFGDEEQRRRWVPRMARGELLGAFSLSEAHAGSDAANVRTTARRSGDHYVVNGSKYWVTNAGVADVYTVMVRTDAAAGAHG